VLVDALYRPTERDIGAPWARVFLPPNINTSQALALVAPSLQVQTDRPVLLTNICGLFTPGAAQFFQNANFDIGLTSANVNRIAFVTAPVGLVAAAAWYLNWQGQVLVPPGFFIRCSAQFNAGVALNSVSLSAMGWSIPLGTLQLA